MTVREPVSLRARFDVFKRDGFICQYCGAHPPSVVLECDHIVPVAEGGGSETDNLITACFGCNRGKGPVPLSVVPQTLAEKAREVAEREAQIRGYAVVMEAKRQRVEDDAWRVMEALYPGQDTAPRVSLQGAKTFIERLGVHAAIDAAEIAAAAGPWWSESRRFRYFCGICWARVRELGDEA